MQVKPVIYDAHVYIGSDYHTYFHQLRDYSVDSYRATAIDCGISKALLIPGGYGSEIEVRYGQIREAVRKEPNRFAGLMRVLPRQKNVLDQIEQAIRDDGMQGIMLHPHWDTYLANAKLLDPIFDLMSDYERPIMVYSGDIPYTMPAQIADMAIKYPKIPIIMGHMAKTELYQHVTASALRCDNLFLETSGCNITNIIEDAVARLGASRILFGSGWPGMSPHAEIYKINKLKITAEQREWVLSKTFASLFPMTGPATGEAV